MSERSELIPQVVIIIQLAKLTILWGSSMHVIIDSSYEE